MISDKGPEELCLSESIPVNTKLMQAQLPTD